MVTGRGGDTVRCTVQCCSCKYLSHRHRLLSVRCGSRWWRCVRRNGSACRREHCGAGAAVVTASGRDTVRCTAQCDRCRCLSCRLVIVRIRAQHATLCTAVRLVVRACAT